MPSDPAAGVPIELTELVPLIPLTVDPAGAHQSETRVQLDTGYGGSLSLPKSIEAMVGELRPEGEALAGVEAHGQQLAILGQAQFGRPRLRWRIRRRLSGHSDLPKNPVRSYI